MSRLLFPISNPGKLIQQMIMSFCSVPGMILDFTRDMVMNKTSFLPQLGDNFEGGGKEIGDVSGDTLRFISTF